MTTSLPDHLRDEFVHHGFHSLWHDHYFEAVLNDTQVRDVLAFSSPDGLLCRCFECLFLTRYALTYCGSAMLCGSSIWKKQGGFGAVQVSSRFSAGLFNAYWAEWHGLHTENRR